MVNRQKKENTPNIIFVSSFLPPHRISSIRNNSRGAMSNANSNFQLSILDGFILNSKHINTFQDFNLPNIGAFPLKYRKPLYARDSYYYKTLKITDVGFVNLPFFKHIFKRYNVIRALSKYINSQIEPPIIIIYDLDRSFIKAINKLRQQNLNFLSIVIIPDLPGMTGDVDHWIYRLLKRKNNTPPDLTNIDGFVLLSESMRNPLKIMDKPYMIMEGIYSIDQEPESDSPLYEVPNPYILYTGALDHRNGIYNLLDAFKNIKDDNINLVLCGDGDAKNYIISQTKKDNRIIYLGQVTHKQALLLQKKAKILINPRPASADFAKFSFPSKTLEYIASGTPLIMYKLDSLPEEYLEHIYIPQDETIESIVKKISELLNDKGINQFSYEKRRAFIRTKKSASYQVSRLIDFSKKLYCNKYEHFN